MSTPESSSQPSFVQQSRDGDVLILTINNPPVNAFSVGVPEGLKAGLDAAAADDSVTAVVIIGGGRTFVAGADIRTFDLPREQSPDLRGTIEKLDAFTKPTVAAIHGTALGGGLELAMGCTYRVAVPGAQVGLPEVKLGVLPGAGGTQRLPRVVGAAKALDMMLSGNPGSSTATCWPARSSSPARWPTPDPCRASATAACPAPRPTCSPPPARGSRRRTVGSSRRR